MRHCQYLSIVVASFRRIDAPPLCEPHHIPHHSRTLPLTPSYSCIDAIQDVMHQRLAHIVEDLRETQQMSSTVLKLTLLPPLACATR